MPTGQIVFPEVKIDYAEFFRTLFTSFKSAFFDNGNRKTTLEIIGLLIIFFGIKALVYRYEAKKRRKAREDKEREKAKIWKEEYKDK